MGLALVVSVGGGGQTRDLVLRADGVEAVLGTSTGSMLSVTASGSRAPLLRTGNEGLWRARLQDGRWVDAASYRSSGAVRTERTGSGAARVRYTGPDLDVAVSVSATARRLELTALVTARGSPVIEFELPARLRFDAASVRRFICPSDGNQSVGMEFNRRFFLPQADDEPSSWAPTTSGPQTYQRLFGATLVQRADQDPPTALHVTDEGRAWLGASAARIEGFRAVVNRPPVRSQGVSALIESDNGPWLAAVPVGKGRAWRIGGAVGEAEAPLALDAVASVAARIVREAPEGRRRIGVLAIRRAPDRGGWSDVGVRRWVERLKRSCEVAEIGAPGELARSLGDGSLAAILNPYGEWCPVLPGKDMAGTADAIAAYVRSGGNWIETGGYPFFYALSPVRHYRHEGRYPAMFADFMHLESEQGSASVYRVQPPSSGPWLAARDPASIFVPGSLACGSDDQGAYMERPYAPVVRAGETWRSPTTRIALGGTPEEGIAAYCKANGVTRMLSEKMAPDVLERFRRSVLLYYAGNAAAKLAAIGFLPRPTLVHFADYLHGGFDKQYPDHLPPNPGFGTMDDLRKLASRCRELGLLWMPYTNPTWWCDHPRGPTFEAAGDAPLLRDLQGKPVYERYAANDGWTTTFWHPAVRKANRRTVRQFATDVPVDVLFQDQCGARGWLYDTNPASPAPHAYTEGLLSMVAEDSRDKPLSTESGWDRVAQYEAQLCGMTWALVPTEYAPEWRRLLRDQYPPEAWTVYPLAQRIAHDKCSMVHHDLGQFVTNDEVLAWTLALGFGLSYTAPADALRPGSRPLEWLNWLDRLQKAICASYVGAPVVSFRHDRPSEQGPEPDDGVIRAKYGPVRISANLGPRPRTVDGRALAAHGFYAERPGATAGRMTRIGSFRPASVAAFASSLRASRRAADLWFYASPGEETAALLPVRSIAHASVAFDGARPIRASVREGVIRVRLPETKGETMVTPPADLAGKAPRKWPGTRPDIGVIDLGGGASPTWTRIQPSDWLRSLRASPIVTTHGLRVRSLSSADDLLHALKAGPRRWLAIVNPYGEGVPAQAPGRWTETLDAIKGYVARGGCWWETGGYTHYSALYRDGDKWATEAIGPAGAARMGVAVGGGPVDAVPVPLRVTALGRTILGPDLAAKVEAAQCPVNRGLAQAVDAPPHATLVTGDGEDYIGGYRLGGWGWYWRIGGFRPEPGVAIPVIAAVLERLYTQPPVPAPRSARPRLLHAVVSW